MPNWCDNSLSVTAFEENSIGELHDFLEKVKRVENGFIEDDFCFQSLVPRPIEEEDNWYDWNIANWGTKWEVSDVSVSVEEDVAYFNFLTAWSPPEYWLKKVAPMFPNLLFQLTFHEGGVGYAGKIVVQGETTFEDFDVGTDNESYWDLVTENMTGEEIEYRALETITKNALDYWTYTFEDLVRYIGEAHKNRLEKLLMVQKLAGKMPHSSSDEFVGREIAEVIEKIIDVESFYQTIFEERKQQKQLKRLVG